MQWGEQKGSKNMHRPLLARSELGEASTSTGKKWESGDEWRVGLQTATAPDGPCRCRLVVGWRGGEESLRT